MKRTLFVGASTAAYVMLAALVCMPGKSANVYTHPSQIVFPEFEFQPPKPLDYRDTLRNGIPLYIAEDHKLPVVDILVIVRTGSIFDPDSLVGLADLTAQVMRTGGTRSWTGDEVDEKMEFLAAKLSCNVSSTSGTASLSILKKDFQEGFPVLLEMLRNPRFAKNKLDLEKKQMREAVAHRWDNPRDALSIGFSCLLYGDFELGRLATRKTIKRIQRRHLVDFHQCFFHPGNMMLAVSGDFKRHEMLQLLDSTFGAWPVVGKEAVPPMPPWSSPTPKGKVFFMEKQTSQAMIQMGHKGIQRPHPDYYALSVLNFILGGGGFTSRLTERIRSNEGLTYDVRSSVGSNYFHPSIFTLSLQTKSQSAPYAIKLCLEELEKVRSAPVSQKELEDAKKILTSSFPAYFKSGEDIATTFCWSEYWGRKLDHFDLYPQKIKTLTTQNLHQAALKHLHPDSLTMTLVGVLEACQNGDGIHPAKLADFGPVQTVNPDDFEK